MGKRKDFWKFSKQEKFDLLISWLVLSFAFAIVINPLLFNITNWLESLPIAMFAVGTGFIFHEIAHRQAARHFGFVSEFRAWYTGLGLALLIAVATGGRFIFAAPGATYFFGENVTRKQNGIISAAGPSINIILGIVLLLIVIFLPMGEVIGKILFFSSMINFWFAFFNLLPVFMLDGKKVLHWKPEVWVLLMGTAAFFVFLMW